MLIYQTENFGNSYDFRRRHHTVFVVKPHIHEFSEIAFVKKGTLTMTINGKTHRVHENEMAFVMPNDVHSYTDETECNIWCAVFSNDFIPLFFSSVGDGVPQNPVLNLSDDTELTMRIENCKTDDLLQISGLLNLLFAKLLKRSVIVEKFTESGHIYKQAVDFISKNFRSDINLSSVAQQLGYHEKYLSSALHSLTKMNFCSFLSSYRIEHAKRLLREKKETTIAEIAIDSGFTALNTFNRVFKTMVGTTPNKYRAAQGNKR